MSDSIPFASGPEKDWPLLAETLERIYQKARADGLYADVDEEMLEAALDDVRQYYEQVNTGDFSLSLELPANMEPELVEALRSRVGVVAGELRAWVRDQNSRGFAERFQTAIRIVRLRRRLGEL